MKTHLSQRETIIRELLKETGTQTLTRGVKRGKKTLAKINIGHDSNRILFNLKIEGFWGFGEINIV